MIGKVLHLRSFSERERGVLALLRGASAEQANAVLSASMCRLTEAARDAGVRIGEADAPYATPDECMLIGCLTLLQRQRHQNGGKPADDALLSLLKDGALRLSAAGYRLPFSSTHRLSAVLQGPVSGVLAGLHSGLAAPTPQGRVMKLITERGEAATAELMAVGATRQTLRGMAQRGLLRRVRHAGQGQGIAWQRVGASISNHTTT